MKYLKLFLLVISFISVVSCSKNENIPTEIEVQRFVWTGLNAYYLWQSEVSDLSDNRFSSDQQLHSYLSLYQDPRNLFQNLLFQPGVVDRFSWIVDDYVALENTFQGIRLNSGMKLKGADFEDGSGGFYVYVYDVVEGSNAHSNNIVRGMIITEVNGTTLTRDNANSLFGNDSFTIHLADFNNGNPTSNGTTISLSKTQFTENPIKITKVISSGTHTIGYLQYNQFSSAFDRELNAAFETFKNQNITDLIVDLRYNGGGSVRTASYLGSMISGLSSNDVFSKQVWNSKVQASIDADNFIFHFADRIVNKDDDGNTVVDEPINSVQLNTVYFIVTEDSASASELVINALTPYMPVKLVGTQTFGKHVGSITLYDSDNFSKTGNNLKNHTWAMQPIVLEIQNKNGENKPQGFTPQIIISETPGNLGVLGEVDEPLLERTITYITTGSRGTPSNRINSSNTFNNWNSNMSNLDYNRMYVDFN